MRNLIVLMNISLDGVMQSPAGCDEDTRGDFIFGGWALPYHAMMYIHPSGPQPNSSLLLGRRTYESFYAYWPRQPNNPISKSLDQIQKYVASTTLREPLPWRNSTLLRGDVPQAVAELKAQAGSLSGADLLVLGSGVLAQTLMEYNLIDRYVLLIHPIVLGSGRRLFPDGGLRLCDLTLLDCKTTPNGVIIATYSAG